jgi:hypothetical protein
MDMDLFDLIVPFGTSLSLKTRQVMDGFSDRMILVHLSFNYPIPALSEILVEIDMMDDVFLGNQHSLVKKNDFCFQTTLKLSFHFL